MKKITKTKTKTKKKIYTAPNNHFGRTRIKANPPECVCIPFPSYLLYRHGAGGCLAFS